MALAEREGVPAVAQRCGAWEGAAAAGSGAAGSNLELREGSAARLSKPCVVLLLGGLSHGLRRQRACCWLLLLAVAMERGTSTKWNPRERRLMKQMVQHFITARIETDVQVAGSMLWRRVVQMPAVHAMDGRARDA